MGKIIGRGTKIKNKIVTPKAKVRCTLTMKINKLARRDKVSSAIDGGKKKYFIGFNCDDPNAGRGHGKMVKQGIQRAVQFDTSNLRMRYHR